ncbi:MAG: hypothetical protein WA446_17540 [Steroidobacteraceae bacterium]
MNASRHAVELVGDELEQAEPAEALTLEPPELLEELLTLCEEPPELLEELPDLAAALPELLLEELPDLAEALPELLLEELPDLAAALPELLEELPDLAEALPELLLEELPDLAEALPELLLEEPPAALLLAAVTWIEKAGSAVMVVPSLAVMTMLGYWPVSGSVGVPESTPVVSPKVAQMGIFRMPKLRGVPLGFSTVG